MSGFRFAYRGLLFGLLAYSATGCVAPPDEDEATSTLSGEGGAQILTIAPSCVARDLHEADDFITLTNHCSTTQNVKVIISFGRDSSCYSIAPGHFRNVLWSSPGKFDSLVLC